MGESMRIAAKQLGVLCVSLAIAGGIWLSSADARPDANDDEVLVLVRLNVPFQAEGKLPEAARANQRRQIEQAQTAFIRELASEGRVNKKYQTVPYIRLQMHRSALARLEHSPRVAQWEVDTLGKLSLFESVPLIGAPAAHSANLTGSGIAVAILDSGVDKGHSYLANRVVSEACYSTGLPPTYQSLCPGGADSSTAAGSGVNCDVNMDVDCHHGTFMAGIVSAKQPSGGAFPVNGVTRYAGIISIQMSTRVNDTTLCGGAPSCIGTFKGDAIEALERVYLLAQGAFTIAAANVGGTWSLSSEPFNGFCDTSVFAQAIANLASVGVATIAPVLNGNAIGTVGEPACVSTAIAVGNTTKQDQVYYGTPGATNSSNALDLWAPGRKINTLAARVNGVDAAAEVTGASASAAHVAGAWAILKQLAPSESVQEILNRFITTGVAITDPRNAITRSRIQVDQAIGPGTLQLDAAAYSVDEGQTVTAYVRRIGGNVGDVSVRCLTVNGTAAEPADYVGVNTVLNWTNGQSASQPCPIQTKTDGVADPLETFNVFLADNAGAALGPPGTVTSTVTINDVPPPPIPGPPTNVHSNTYFTYQSYTMSWTAPASGGVTSYNLQRRREFNDWPTGTGTVVTNTWYYYSAPMTSDYEHRVRACNANGCSAWVEDPMGAVTVCRAGNC